MLAGVLVGGALEPTNRRQRNALHAESSHVMSTQSLDLLFRHVYETVGWKREMADYMVHLVAVNGSRFRTPPHNLAANHRNYHIQEGWGLLMLQAGLEVKDWTSVYRTPYWGHSEPIVDFSGSPRQWIPMNQVLFAPMQMPFVSQIRRCCGGRASCSSASASCFIQDWRTDTDCCPDAGKNRNTNEHRGRYSIPSASVDQQALPYAYEVALTCRPGRDVCSLPESLLNMEHRAYSQERRFQETSHPRNVSYTRSKERHVLSTGAPQRDLSTFQEMSRPYEISSRGSACLSLPQYHATDPYPMRAPLVVADFLADAVKQGGAGASYAEIGTRDGDIIDCVSQLTPGVRAVGIERSARRCETLRQRARGRFEVTEASLNSSNCADVLPRASVFYFWIGIDALNLDFVRDIHSVMRARGERATVYVGYDWNRPSDREVFMKQVRSYEQITTRGRVSVHRLFFDEQGKNEERLYPRAKIMVSKSKAMWQPSYDKPLDGRYGAWGVFHLVGIRVGPSLMAPVESRGPTSSIPDPAPPLPTWSTTVSENPAQQFAQVADSHVTVAVVGSGPNALRLLACLQANSSKTHVSFDRGIIGTTIRNW